MYPAPLEPCTPPISERPATPLDLALAQLELSDGQRYEIDALLRAEEPWVAEILELLEPQQRSIFSRLRARDPSARRVVTSRRPTLVSALP